MKAEDYRIKELNGIFTIERRYYFRPFLYKEIVWYPCDINGKCVNLYNKDCVIPSYDNIENAKKAIELFCTEPVYHYFGFKTKYEENDEKIENMMKRISNIETKIKEL